MAGEHKLDELVPPPRRGIVIAGHVGYAAEGVVYCVLGALALLAAFGASGGRLTDSRGAIEAIGSQPWGAALLWATAVGLLCYALWNAVRAALDPEHKGKDAKGALMRIGYGVSSGFHVLLALYAAQLAHGAAQRGEGTRTWVAKLLELPLGALWIALCGAIAIGFGLAQMFVAVKGKVGEQYASAPLGPRVQRMARRAARVGVFSRGLVFPVIGGSLIIAALQHDPSEADGFGQALGELARSPAGGWLLAFVAAGLVAYGVHLFFVARYGRLPEPH